MTMNQREPTSALGTLPGIASARRRLSLRSYLTRESLLVVLTLAAIVGASLAYPTSFPTFRNFSALLRNMAMDGIMACGMVVLLVSGMFDLSVGSMLSMAGVLTGWLLTQAHVPAPLAIVAGLGLAACGGALNGWIVAKVRVNALIATLGTMQIFRGIAVLVGGPGIANLPPSFAQWGQAQWLGLQAPVWLMLAVAAVGQFLMAKSRFFRRYYYIGANAKAASLSGIPVDRMLILAFTLMGLLAGLAGIAFASRMATANSTAGDGAELRIITAVILGGASLQGGRGTVWGTLVGVFFISLINNVMIFARLSPEWQSIVIGMVLVAAVAMDRFLSRRV
jgi:ribose/xylose/arabinose/galactoside ABC-type transport system permease subunit